MALRLPTTRRRLTTAACVLALVHGPWLGLAETVTLRPAADTTLFESAPNDNMGGWTHVAAGSTGNQSDRTRNRGLFRFDLAGVVPAGSTVTNAVLSLKVVRVPGNTGGGGPVNSTFALHRVLQPWGEGDKLGDRGFHADPSEATWNHRLAPDQPWSVPGGAAPADFAASSSATQAIAGRGHYPFGSSSNLVSDVQYWLDHPLANFGWILLSQSEAVAKTARGFGSREAPEDAPVLLVEFTPPVPIHLEVLGVRTNGFFFQVAAPPGGAYAVEVNERLGTDGWTALTNLSFSAATNALVFDAMSAPRRFYRVRRPREGRLRCLPCRDQQARRP